MSPRRGDDAGVSRPRAREGKQRQPHSLSANQGSARPVQRGAVGPNPTQRGAANTTPIQTGAVRPARTQRGGPVSDQPSDLSSRLRILDSSILMVKAKLLARNLSLEERASALRELRTQQAEIDFLNTAPRHPMGTAHALTQTGMVGRSTMLLAIAKLTTGNNSALETVRLRMEIEQLKDELKAIEKYRV
jgi:hypothetical protein